MTQCTLCPHCGVSLRLPHGSLGKRVICTGCKEVFVATPEQPTSNNLARVIACPFCKARVRLAREFEGKKVRCSSCRLPFQTGPAALESAGARPAAKAVSADSTSTVECPFCGVRLRLGRQFLGKKVRCSACRHPFHSSAVAPPAPAADRKPPPERKAGARSARVNGRSAAGEHVRAKCPECGIDMKLRKAYAGKRVSCPFCAHAFQAPSPEGEASSLRSRLLEEVRKMRSRDGAPAQERQRKPARSSPPEQLPPRPAPAAASNAALEGSGYELVTGGTAAEASAYGLSPQQPSAPPPLTPGSPLPSMEPTRPNHQPAEPEDNLQILPEDLELARNGPMRRRSTKTGRGDYPRVFTGLTLNLGGAVGLLACFSFTLLAILCSAKALYDATDPYAPQPEPSIRIPITLICLVVLTLLTEAAHLVGVGYCLGAPTKDSARTFAMITLLVGSLGLSLLCIAGALGLAARYGTAAVILLIVGLLVTLIAKAFYLLFVRALGLALEKTWLGRQVFGTISLIAAAILFHWLVLIGAGSNFTGDIAGVITGLGNGAGLRDMGLSPYCFWLGSLLVLLYALIRCVITVNDARSEVAYHLMGRQ